MNQRQRKKAARPVDASARQVRVDLRVVCPFCPLPGGAVLVLRDAVGVASLAHTMPPCQAFLDSDADAYMRDVRVWLEAHPAPPATTLPYCPHCDTRSTRNGELLHANDCGIASAAVAEPSTVGAAVSP